MCLRAAPSQVTRVCAGYLWLWVNIFVVLALFVFVVMQSPVIDGSSSYWGLLSVLGVWPSHRCIRHHARVNV